MESDAQRHWQSTKDKGGPDPNPTPGTFRDADLSSFDIGLVDRIDACCQRNEIARSDFLHRAIHVALNNQEKLSDPEFLSSRNLQAQPLHPDMDFDWKPE